MEKKKITNRVSSKKENVSQKKEESIKRVDAKAQKKSKTSRNEPKTSESIKKIKANKKATKSKENKLKQETNKKIKVENEKKSVDVSTEQKTELENNDNEVSKNDEFVSNNITFNKIYIGFYPRLVLRSLCALFFFILSGFLVYKSFKYNPDEVVNFSEKSNIDYKVYLKENGFFETPFLDKGMNYIASLIDHIDVAFDYDFSIDRNINADFRYNVVGKLTIEDETGNTFFEKSYTLAEGVTDSISNANSYKLSKTVSIDYDYYNNLANSFKSSYGINAVSNLKVILNIEKKDVDKTENLMIDELDNMSLSIPLSARSINISLQQKDINDSKSLIRKAQVVMESKTKLLVAVMSFAIACIYLYKAVMLLFKSRTKKSKYDKFVGKLLVQYDRLIVETTYCPDFKDFQIVKINSFTEMLDVRDNLKMPIMYYSVAAHQKCYFYILNNSILYLLTVKAVDLEKQNM